MVASVAIRYIERMVGPSPAERVFLEAALLREVASTWDDLAESHFPAP